MSENESVRKKSENVRREHVKKKRERQREFELRRLELDHALELKKLELAGGTHGAKNAICRNLRMRQTRAQK